jgi:hypothetical protein
MRERVRDIDNRMQALATASPTDLAASTLLPLSAVTLDAWAIVVPCVSSMTCA